MLAKVASKMKFSNNNYQYSAYDWYIRLFYVTMTTRHTHNDVCTFDHFFVQNEIKRFLGIQKDRLSIYLPACALI